MIDDVALQAKLQPNKLALKDLAQNKDWSYAKLDNDIALYASALLNTYKLNVGDRVAALSANRAELIILHWACARTGMIFVPLNWRLSGAELDYLLENSDPGLIVGDEKIDSLDIENKIYVDDFIAQAETLEPLPHLPIDKDLPSLILYTSGTSGKPKGAMLSETNLDQVALNGSILCRVTHESVFLCDAPIFHIIGLATNVRPTFNRGGTLLLSNGFKPEITLQRLADPSLKVTHIFGVPQMAMMLRQEESFNPDDLKGLTAVFTGGAPHPEANIRAWLNDGIPVVDGFGMSEAGTVFGMSVEIDVISQKAGSVGLPTPNVKARIIDDKGNDCPNGTSGELLLKGPNIMLGYWKRPEATQAAFTEDGWFKTGDVAMQDEDGFYYLVDRKKDMYISGGENVYPAEVEAAFAGMDNIIEAAVVGVPDDKWGEVGHLAVVCKSGTSITLEQALEYLEPRLARYKLPKHLSCIEKLPRTSSGKVQKAELKNLLLAL